MRDASTGVPLELRAQRQRQGLDAGHGFAFDNELGRLEVDLPTCAVDTQVVRWAEHLPFVAAGGYDQARGWCEAASHLAHHEAEAWCQWAGGGLPAEAQWECAACEARGSCVQAPDPATARSCCDHRPMNSINSRASRRLWVANRPCGAPSYSTSVL